MIDLKTERDTRRAALEPWRCEGRTRGDALCNRLLMMLDWNRPSFIQVKCSGCGHMNTFVESRQPV